MLGGNVYVGGEFTFIGGQFRNHLAALHESDALATNWNPSADDSVSRIVISDPILYVGGQARSQVAAVDINTGLAGSWNLDAFGGQVSTITLGSNTVYLGGEFTKFGGKNRLFTGAVDLATGAVTNWNPRPLSGSGDVEFSGFPDSIGLSETEDLVYLAGAFVDVARSGHAFVAPLQSSESAP